MKNKKGLAVYLLFLLVAVGLVITGLLTSKQPRIARDEDEKPPATSLRALGGEHESG